MNTALSEHCEKNDTALQSCPTRSRKEELRSLNITHIVGARPNFMKIAPIMAELESRDRFNQSLIHTGQHYDHGMSGTFFRELGIPEPDLDLGVGSGSHARQTAAVMEAFEPVLQEKKPELMVVVGDVNSTLACALVAAKMHVRVAHVEAGLRSGDRSMPEEINRILTDQLADLLLTPSPDGDRNLLREGIPSKRIFRVGNIMIDSLRRNLDRARGTGALEKFRVEAGGFVLVTLHRPSNVDEEEQLGEIFDALAGLAEERPVLFPMHPRTRKSAESFRLMPRLGSVRALEPIGYHEMLSLMENSSLVLTDSGGIQEETTALGVPCLTLRDTTERPITVTEGTNTLVPVRTKEAILRAAAGAGEKRGRIPDLWDGRTAKRIADVFQKWAHGG